MKEGDIIQGAALMDVPTGDGIAIMIAQTGDPDRVLIQIVLGNEALAQIIVTKAQAAEAGAKLMAEGPLN